MLLKSEINCEKMNNQEIQASDLVVKATIKRKPRFKAGSDLTSTVNVKKLDVEIDDISTEDAEEYIVTVQLHNSTQ